MNVLVVSGIWPPEVGGPASHAPELAEFLRARGHAVEVVVAADAAPAPREYPLRWVSRRRPPGVRHLDGAVKVANGARNADVVYSTGMIGRSALGSALARTPLVVKITGDAAYERALRRGVTRASLAEFQQERSARAALLRALRNSSLARATTIVSPSAALRDIAVGWGIEPGRIEVLPNPVEAPALEPREELRRRLGLRGPTLVFAGRLAPQKSLEVALAALGRLEAVSLVIAGDGPERARLEAEARTLGDRVRFLGVQPRKAVFELLAAGDAAVLPSSWENFPHMAVEALAVGTPVIATRAGGVTEIVDDRNGMLVPAGDAPALAEAVERYFGDDELRTRLRAAAQASVERFSPARVYGRLEKILAEAAR